MMEFVSWNDDIPKIWKVIKIYLKIMFQTTNQIIICSSIFRIKIVILSEWCGSFGHLGLQIGAVPQFVAIIMAYLRRPANKKNHDACWLYNQMCPSHVQSKNRPTKV